MLSKSLRRLRIRFFQQRSRMRSLGSRLTGNLLRRYHNLPHVQRRFFAHTGYKTPEEARGKMLKKKKQSPSDAYLNQMDDNTRLLRSLREAYEKESKDFHFPWHLVRHVYTVARKILTATELDDYYFQLGEYEECIDLIRHHTVLDINAWAKSRPYYFAKRLGSPFARMLQESSEGAAEIALVQVGIGTKLKRDNLVSEKVMALVKGLPIQGTGLTGMGTPFTRRNADSSSH